MPTKASSAQFRRNWARLIQKIYAVDPLICPKCQGAMRIIAFIENDLKNQISMRLFHQFRNLKRKPYWGNHFCSKGYCVDTVGLNADMIRKYVRYQEKKEQQLEQLQLID